MTSSKFLKKESRVLGFDDAPFKKDSKENNLIIGVIMRGPELFEGLISTKVRVDGFNSTARIIESVNASKFKHQLKAILFDGICLSGFNVLDLEAISKRTGIPAITIMRKPPNFNEIREALKRVSRPKFREEIMMKAGPIYSVDVKNKNCTGRVFFQFKGCSREYAENIIKLMTFRSLVPEPLRIAHLIASGIKLGESRGQA